MYVQDEPNPHARGRKKCYTNKCFTYEINGDLEMLSFDHLIVTCGEFYFI